MYIEKIWIRGENIKNIPISPLRIQEIPWLSCKDLLQNVSIRFPVLHRERVLVSQKAWRIPICWIKCVGGGACKSNVIMTIDVLRLLVMKE